LNLPVLKPGQLGIQAHCLRFEMAQDFPGTLDRLTRLGLNTIELCSFPGCSGNPWGDFGKLAECPPRLIRDQLNAAGMNVIACHFMAEELAPGNIDTAISWAKDVGSPTVVLAGFAFQGEPSLADWQASISNLNEIGERLARDNLHFAYHTQNNTWSRAEGISVFDEILRLVDPNLCSLELDPSGTLVYDTPWTEIVRQLRGRFLCMHLRDSKRPPTHVPHLPALALGEGDMDWEASFGAATDARVPYYLLEMEVETPRSAFEAIETSLDWLKTNGMVSNRTEGRVNAQL
jgi:sugar phosphate isomerase/epimerase